MDFRKAFDTLEWNAVWEALYAHRVHVTLIHTFRRLYEASRTLITVNGDRVEVSVQEFDKATPSLCLFNAVLRHAIDSIDWETNGLNINCPCRTNGSVFLSASLLLVFSLNAGQWLVNLRTIPLTMASNSPSKG